MKKLIFFLMPLLMPVLSYAGGDVTAVFGPGGGNIVIQTAPGATSSGGASTLAVGTGTASNFTTLVTSPTAVVSFLGSQFQSVADGTTNFVRLNSSSVTTQGVLVAGSNITLTPGTGITTISASGSGGVTQCATCYLLIVGTGSSSSNFTNVITSPTLGINLDGSLFTSVANGTTNFISVTATVTRSGTLIAGSNITLTPGTGITTISATGSGGGSSIYPATGTPTFPFGASFSSASINEIFFPNGMIRSVDLSASAGVCRLTTGCATSTQYESTTTFTNYVSPVFQAGATQYWQVTYNLPNNYLDASTFTVTLDWLSTSTSRANFYVEMKAVASGENVNTGAFGSAVNIFQTGGTGTEQKTATSAAITAAGTPARKEKLWIQVSRGDAGADVYLLGLTFNYLTFKLSTSD